MKIVSISSINKDNRFIISFDNFLGLTKKAIQEHPCAYCGINMETTGLDVKEEEKPSHGICPNCYVKEMRKINVPNVQILIYLIDRSISEIGKSNLYKKAISQINVAAQELINEIKRQLSLKELSIRQAIAILNESTKLYESSVSKSIIELAVAELSKGQYISPKIPAGESPSEMGTPISQKTQDEERKKRLDEYRKGLGGTGDKKSQNENKIKLSKAQWQFIGQKIGWIK